MAEMDEDGSGAVSEVEFGAFWRNYSRKHRCFFFTLLPSLHKSAHCVLKSIRPCAAELLIPAKLAMDLSHVHPGCRR